MRNGFIEFVPSHHICWPEITSRPSEGRLGSAPHRPGAVDVTFEGEKQDAELPATAAEARGILAWAIRGASIGSVRAALSPSG